MNKMSDVELCAFREQNGAELKHRAYEVRFEQVAGGNMRVRAGLGWNTRLRWRGPRSPKGHVQLTALVPSARCALFGACDKRRYNSQF